MLASPAPEDRRITLVTGSRNLRRFVQRSLASAGYKPRHVEWDRDSVEQELASGLDMLLIDVDSSEGDINWLLEHMAARHPSTISLLMSRDFHSPVIKGLLDNPGFNNLVAKHGGLTTSEIIDETELIVTTEKLFRRDIFGIDKYIPPSAIRVYERAIHGTEDKKAALAALAMFLEEIDCFGAVRPSVMLVADELLMNAMFNAPIGPDGSAKYAGRDRRLPLELEEDEVVQFSYACDGKNIALGVRDGFGSLDREIIVRYLKQSFERGPGVMEEKRSGAGLGLFMVFNSITQLTFNIELGVTTEVLAMFFARKGAKGMHSSGRSLHIFLI